tara:strand:+ start:2313 stop:2813 length:501 start_codon:yes stop_codon:yes gene_type:complete
MATEQLLDKSIIFSPQCGTVTILQDRIFTDEQGNILAKRPNIANSLTKGQLDRLDTFGKYKPLVVQFWELLAAHNPEPVNKIYKITKYTKNGGILGNLNGNGSTYVYADFASGELANGDSITITGSDEPAYNSTWTIQKTHAGYGRFAIPLKFVSNPANKGSFTIN